MVRASCNSGARRREEPGASPLAKVAEWQTHWIQVPAG